MLFGIYMGFLAVMVGLLIAAVIVTIIMMICGRSIVDSFSRLFGALGKLFKREPKVKERRTIYEENGVMKEVVEKL